MKVTVTATDPKGNVATASATATVSTPARFPGDLGPGYIRYGCSVDGGNPSTRESFYGTSVQVYRSYWQASQTSSMVSVCQRDTNAGRLPLASTKLPATWGNVAAGMQDAWIKTMMNGLATVTGPVWLCLHHEPVDDAAAAGSGMTAADYVAMYRHVAKFLPSNVILVPILQAAPFDPSVGGSQDPTQWYATDVCPILGFDSYCHWYPGGTNKWRDPTTTFKAMCDHIEALGRPCLVAEYGVRTDPANPGKAAQWMADARTYLLSRGAVAMSFFDSSLNVNDGGTPWTLDYNGDTERLDEFKSILLGNKLKG